MRTACLCKEFLYSHIYQRRCYSERMSLTGSLGRKKPPSKIGFPFWWLGVCQFLLEEQTEPDPLIPLRLLQYDVAIMHYDIEAKLKGKKSIQPPLTSSRT